MRQWLAIAGVGLMGLNVGCRYNEDGPPPDRARLTRIVDERYGNEGQGKPLPPPNSEDLVPPQPFDDAPLVSQRMPEEDAFFNAYNGVGRPKIVVFVNRTLEGQLVPVSPNTPSVTVDRQVTGRTPFRDTVDVYLRPGQYDEVQAKSLDYEAIENILSDWLSASGRVQIVSPSLARQRLTDQQVKELQSGRPTAAREIAQQLDASILIQVQAHPTSQTNAGLSVRLIAEAIDLKHDGASVGRAVVDVPPPLDKVQINRYTRFVARKLMDGMISSWQPYMNRGQFGTPRPPEAPVWPAPVAPPVNPLPPIAPAPPSSPTGQNNPPPIWPHDPSPAPALIITSVPTTGPAPAPVPAPADAGSSVTVPLPPPLPRPQTRPTTAPATQPSSDSATSLGLTLVPLPASDNSSVNNAVEIPPLTDSAPANQNK